MIKSEKTPDGTAAAASPGRRRGLNGEREMTKLDRIKNMTADELAELLGTKACKCCAYLSFAPCGFGAPACEEGIKKWLEQEGER